MNLFKFIKQLSRSQLTDLMLVYLHQFVLSAMVTYCDLTRLYQKYDTQRFCEQILKIQIHPTKILNAL